MSKEEQFKWMQDSASCSICGQIHEGKCDIDFLINNKLTWMTREQLEALLK